MQPGDENIVASVGAKCPSDEVLLELLEGRLPEPDQASQVEHLDGCGECRLRLEELAGGTEFSAKAVRNIRETADDEQTDWRHWLALTPTRSGLNDDTPTPADDEPSLDFLAPCEKPGRLGMLDRYEILDVVGQGGMGLVLEAFDPGLDRLVAIKLLATSLASRSKAKARFRREARAAAAVRSEHTVTIYAVEDTAELPYIVMEYVPGTSLQERIDQTAGMEVDDVLRIGSQIARGLDAAHRQGLIHRDVKPANVLIDDATETAKITDFGLARAIDGSSFTRFGTVVGTPEYMAPEQTGPGPVDHRADLFSLGSVLYAMCVGKPPFRGELAAVLRCTREETPPPIPSIRPDLPQALVHLIEKLHRKDPAERYSSAAEVAEALERIAADPEAASAEAPAAASERASDEASPEGDGRKRFRWRRVVLAAALLLAVSLGLSEVAGFTRVLATAATLLRFQTPEGTLLVDVKDPAVQVTVDSGTGELVVTGAGIHELRVRAGERRIQATRDGRPILDDVITVTRDGRNVVTVRQEPPARLANRDAAAADVRTTTATASGDVPAVSGEPLRVQVLPRDALLRESIQAQKDELAEEPSPFLVRKLEGHTGPVNDVAFSPDGKTILSCSGFPTGDRSVRLWDVASGSEIRQFEVDPPRAARISGGREAPGEFYCAAFTPDGARALAGGEGGSICVWDVESGKIVKRFKGHTGTVYGIAVSPDGRRVLSGGRDMTARLWDIETGEEIFRLPSHNSWVRSVAISPDGRYGLTGSFDRYMRLWDLETGRKLQELKTGTNWVWRVAFSPDGKLAASASRREIRLWDFKKGEFLESYKGHLKGVTGLTFSPDGSRLLSASYDSTVRVWDVHSGEQLQVLHGHRDWAWNAAFSPDGLQVVSCGGGRDLPTGDVGPGIDFAIRIWKAAPAPTTPRSAEPAEEALLPPLVTFKGHRGDVRAALFADDGRKLVSAGRDAQVRVFDVPTGRLLHRFDHREPVHSLAISPDGKTLATGGRAVRLWDIETGENVGMLTGHLAAIRGLVYSPDGKTLFSAGEDRIIRFWDAVGHVELKSLPPQEKPIHGITLSPDGTVLASASGNYHSPEESGQVKLWDATTGDEMSTLPDYSTGYCSVAFTEDGRTLLFSDATGRIRLWNMEKNQLAGEMTCERRANAIALITPGNLLAVGGWPGTISIWNLSTKKRLAVYEGHNHLVHFLASSPDGTAIASAGADDTLKLWATPNAEGTEGTTAEQIRRWPTSVRDVRIEEPEASADRPGAG